MGSHFEKASGLNSVSASMHSAEPSAPSPPVRLSSAKHSPGMALAMSALADSGMSLSSGDARISLVAWSQDFCHRASPVSAAGAFSSAFASGAFSSAFASGAFSSAFSSALGSSFLASSFFSPFFSSFLASSFLASSFFSPPQPAARNAAITHSTNSFFIGVLLHVSPIIPILPPPGNGNSRCPTPCLHRMIP